MQADYWHQRWANQDTPFHERDTNPLLLKHLASLSLPLGARLFLPLCGKTLDIRWLLSLGYRVAGAELSPLAIEQLFTGLGIEPEITPKGPIAHYHAPDLDLFVGDIFDLTRTMLGPIDAIYDRAALVALPASVWRAALFSGGVAVVSTCLLLALALPMAAAVAAGRRAGAPVRSAARPATCRPRGWPPAAAWAGRARRARRGPPRRAGSP